MLGVPSLGSKFLDYSVWGSILGPFYLGKLLSPGTRPRCIRVPDPAP